MAVCTRRRLLAALTALTLIAALSGAISPRGAAAERPGGDVYLLRGGDDASDEAAARALRDRGLNVTSGVATDRFDGSQAALADYDVLVILYTANWALPVPPAGLQAIRAYVEGGGSLVTGEWFGWRGQLAALMPAINCGWNTTSETTYTQVAPNPWINAGLPSAFTFALGDFTGSESCLQARPEATVLYGSSNGGGKGPGVGLAAWNVGEGRVAAFSTLLSASELASEEYRTLFQNTVAWAADVRDATPPTIQSVALTGAGGMVRDRRVTLSLKAADRGGAGVASFIVVEYVFTGDEASTWRLAASSGWRRYSQPRATLDWTLSETPGVHYLLVYAADRAGNISRDPGVTFVSYQPAGPTPIGLDEAHLYRVTLADQPQMTARMRVLDGNPDLSVVGPGVRIAPVSDAGVEEISFAAEEAGVYEFGVLGYEAGAYSLEFGPARGAPSEAEDVIGIERRGRGSVISAFPPEPEGDPGELPPPPAAGIGQFSEPKAFLPAVQRP